MSLNRIELALYDYIRTHPEERQYWRDKVRARVAEAPDAPAAVARIESELWRYFTERSAVLPALGGNERASRANRISMKNLAEFLARIWTEPKPGKPAPAGPDLTG